MNEFPEYVRYPRGLDHEKLAHGLPFRFLLDDLEYLACTLKKVEDQDLVWSARHLIQIQQETIERLRNEKNMS